MRRSLLLILLVGCASEAAPELPGREPIRVQGVPVHGMAEKRLADGSVVPPASRFELTRPPDVTGLIDADAAARAAAQALAPGAALEPPQLVLAPRRETRRLRRPGPRGPTATDFEKVVVSLDPIYLVRAREPDGERVIVRLDARNGAVTARESAMSHDFVPESITANTRYHGQRNLVALLNDETGTVFLKDLYGNTYRYGRGETIYTAPPGSVWGTGRLFPEREDPDGKNGRTATVDAFAAVHITNSLLWDLYGIDVPNGRGEPLRIVLHLRGVYGARSFTPDHIIEVGYFPIYDRSGLTIPAAGLSTIAHEMGHDLFDAFVGFSALPGAHAALAEATGDILAHLAAAYEPSAWAGGPGHFALKGDCRLHGGYDGSPSRDTLWPPEPIWREGIESIPPHDAMGPIGRMFCLLALGAWPWVGVEEPQTSPFTPDGVEGVGFEEAGRVWIETLRALPIDGDFADARRIALQVTAARTGLNSRTYKAVQDAFAAVNIGPASDRRPPRVAVFATQLPAGEVELIVTATDDESGIDPGELVELTVNGTRSFLGTAPSFAVRIPTAELRHGANVARVDVLDRDGNRAVVDITFQVDALGPAVVVSRSGPPKRPLLTVTAVDLSGVSHVTFSRAGQPFAIDASAPYAVELDTSAWSDGNHTIDIVAHDAMGNRTQTTTVIVADNTPPAVTLAATGNPPPFTITITASDASAITQTQVRLDAAVLATFAAPPVTVAYTPTDAASHTISAHVTDAFGNVAIASMPAPRDTTPPHVTLAHAQQGLAVTLSGTVTDSCPLVFPIRLSVDGTTIANFSASTFSIALPQSLFLPGNHVARAEVSDACGNLATVNHTFPVYTNTPGVGVYSIDYAVDKRPVVRVNLVHDRPIVLVQVWRGTTVLERTSGPWEFTFDTSTWPSGPNQINILARDAIGIIGQGQGTVNADNTPPAIINPSLVFQGFGVALAAGAVQDTHNQVARVEMQCWPFLPTVTFLQPPYRAVFQMPAYAGTSDVWCRISALDTWGNWAHWEVVQTWYRP